MGKSKVMKFSRYADVGAEQKRGINLLKCLYEEVIVPTALYGAEAWGMRSADRRNANDCEMKNLRILVRVERKDRIMNEVR